MVRTNRWKLVVDNLRHRCLNNVKVYSTVDWVVLRQMILDCGMLAVENNIGKPERAVDLSTLSHLKV